MGVKVVALMKSRLFMAAFLLQKIIPDGMGKSLRRFDYALKHDANAGGVRNREVKTRGALQNG
jgi:hypothetical protein